MNGYRKMIDDRIPKTWDMALKWCKAKKRYVEHIYSYTCAGLNTDCMHTRAEKKQLKEQAIRDVFNGKSFKSTLFMDRVLLYNSTEYDYWVRVISWVTWFSTVTLYITTSAKNYRMDGYCGEELLKQLTSQYKYDKKVMEFIIKYYGLWLLIFIIVCTEHPIASNLLMQMERTWSDGCIG